MYIEPAASAYSSEGLLLAGTHNYLWRYTQPPQGQDITGDSVFGVVLPPSGAPILVHPPVPAPRRSLGAIRVAADPDGGWDVVWGNQAPGTRIEAQDFPRLWYAHLLAGRWRSVSVLPVPEGYALVGKSSSALIRVGDTLALAVPISSPSSPYSKVAFYRRAGSGWSVTVVPTHDAAEVSISYAAGFVLAVVEPDGSETTSLFLYREQRGWRRVRKLASGATRQVTLPRLQLRTSPPLATWMLIDGRDGSASVEALVDPLDSVKAQELGRGVTTYSLVGEPGGKPIWVLRTATPTQFRFQVGSIAPGGEATSIGAPQPSPFFAGVSDVAERRGQDLVFSGPRARPGRDPFVTTELLSYRLDCGPAR